MLPRAEGSRNLDAVIVCRKRSVNGSSSQTDPIEAAEVGDRRLMTLKAAGVEVGAGDIRSVIRGHVLATYTENPNKIDVDSLAILADELATERVTRLMAVREND